jgi:uncharacterized protein (DUF2249 family)
MESQPIELDVRDTGTPASSRRLTTLDVRPYHVRHEEPFDAIMSAVASLADGQDLILINSFEPTPLLAVMRKRGFASTCTEVGPDEWHVLFTRDP